MMYVFICPKCGATRMVSLLRSLDCQACESAMANCELDYIEWTQLTKEQRNLLINIYRNAEKEKLCFKRPLPVYDRRERKYYF